MKKHLVWIIALLAGLFSSCLIDREAEARAEQNLQEVGELYHTEKSICDSLLDVATSYYLPDLAKGDTILSSLTSSPKQAECMLYEGIRHHDNAQQLKPEIEAYAAEMDKAYRLFLEVKRNEDLFQNPYLKVVVNNRLARINDQNGDYRQALPFFRKELHYAFQTGDTTDIALSYLHLAYIFNNLEIGDSTLYYSNRALSFAPNLDGRIISALYNNLAFYFLKFGHEKYQGENLLNSIEFDGFTRDDSCRFYCVLVDYLLQKGEYIEADTILNWTISHSDDKTELLSMAFLRRSKMFEQMRMLDSALVYRKLLEEQRSISRQTELSAEIAEAHGRYERIQQQRHHDHVVFTIIIITLLFIVFLLFMWVRHIKKTKQLEHRIASINAKMEQYSLDITQLQSSLDLQLAESQDKEKKLRLQLNQSRSDYYASRSKIERMLSHFFLLRDETSWPTEILDELLDIYRQASSERKELLDELDRLSLSPRQKVICLLIRESKHDPKQLWFYAGCVNEAAFQSSKSQIKRKLQEAAPSSPVIQSLLKYFPQERTSVSMAKPKLKNDSK